MTTETVNKTRDTMSLVERYNLMHLVKTEHGKGRTDAEFAAYAQQRLGFKVLPGTVSTYREAFELPQTKLAKPTELRARIRELEEKLKAAAAQPEPVPVPKTEPAPEPRPTVQIGGRTFEVPPIPRYGDVGANA